MKMMPVNCQEMFNVRGGNAIADLVREQGTWANDGGRRVREMEMADRYARLSRAASEYREAVAEIASARKGRNK